jgi:hypothetical protein
MIGRRAVVGLSLLSALVFFAFSASSALAVNGTTAFTCVKSPAVLPGFKDEHCKEAAIKAEEVKFKHEEIKQDLTTSIHFTNKTTIVKEGEKEVDQTEDGVLAVKIFGAELEIICKKIFGHAELTNSLDATTKEHRITIKKVTIHYTECTVSKPAGCVIPEKTVLVEGVEGTTEKQEDSIKFKPEVGTTFVTITLEKCTNGLFNGKHEIKGSVKAQTEGATLKFVHATVTAEKTLTFAGAATGINGRLTVSSAKGTLETDATETPISPTTVT